MQYIFELFASLGYGMIAIVLVVASTAAMTLCVSLFASVAQWYVFTKLDADNLMGLGAWAGGVLGLVWSIWAVSTAGIVSAFLSVLALAATVLFACGLIGFVFGRRPAIADPATNGLV
jgi:hypothetical protein